ncbi:MAG TPA: thioredoxin TrxC [Casimicrobiaceae bacterium]|nr:thioredoxin TrxC [Casimicrobiaceae bacterium]
MQLVCPHCGARNRVLDERLSDGPACGACHAALAPAEALPIEGARFERYVAGTELPVLVDFWAEWCGPCKMMAPAFAEAAKARPRVRFVKLDTEQAQDVAARYAIRGIPTLILFAQGREKARVSGAMGTSQILGWLDQQLRA